MKYILLLLVCLSVSIASYSQEPFIEQIFGFEHAEPRSILEHAGQYFCSYNNGQVSVFDSKALQPRSVQTPSGTYVTDLYSSDGLLWIHTSSGRLYYSSNSGVSWVMYGQRVAALFKPSGDGIYVVSVDTIRFLRRNGAKISDSVVRVLPGSRSIESFAVKSDTTIVMYQASDSMTVLVGNSSSARSLQPWERAGRFNQFSDGSVVYVSTYNRVYIQHSSLESGFRDFTSQIPIPALTAHGTGSIGSALTLVFAGYNSRQNPDTIIVSRIGPTRDGRYVLVRQAIPSISIGTITLHDDTVYTLSGNGKVIRHTETSLDSSESIIPDESSSTFAHANVLRIDGITRSLRAYSKEIGYRCLLYTEQEVTEPFVSESIDFRDSIGELHQLLGDEQNGFTASGSKCIAFSASLLGPWRRTLQVKGGNIFRLGDGGMVASLKGNAIGLSEDTGKSWSIHYVKGMFGGFVQAVESKDFLALNRRSELYIVPRYLVGTMSVF